MNQLEESDPFNLTGVHDGTYDDHDKEATAERQAKLLRTLASDLYDLHVRTSISLDNWKSARTFVERFYGPIAENGA